MDFLNVFIILLFIILIFVVVYMYLPRNIIISFIHMHIRRVLKNICQASQNKHSLHLFSAMLSHELKNALTCSLFAFEGKDMKNLESSFQDLQNIVENIEYFSHKDIKPHYENIYIKHFIKSLKKSLKKHLKEKNIYFIENIKMPDIFIYSDKKLLFHIIRNLIHNAIKFTPDNGIIYLSFQRTTKNIKIQIEDSGRGISQENISKIFNPYYSFESAEGKGIGLYICEIFTKALSGSISVKTKLQKGSVFTVKLPNIS
jgi:signal transduction histidine kinase